MCQKLAQQDYHPYRMENNQWDLFSLLDGSGMAYIRAYTVRVIQIFIWFESFQTSLKKSFTFVSDS